MLILHSEEELTVGMNGVFTVHSTNGRFACDLGVLIEEMFSLAALERAWSTLEG